MDKQTTDSLTAVLSAAQAPAVLWSGGKDSTLLLLTARQLGYNLPAIWFRDGIYDDFVMKLAYDLDLSVYSWSPANIYLVAHDGSAALVSEFSLNGEMLPMLTDVHADRDGLCLASSTDRTPQLYMPFDLLLSGYKDCDTHWAVDGGLLYPEGLTLGGTKLVAPIRHLTDAQVHKELIQLGAAFKPRSDEIAICPDCLAGKPLHWDRPLDLTAFRTRTGLNH